MDDQSPLAILNYIKQTGIKNIELMGNHAEPFAGAPVSSMSDPAKLAILIKQYRKEALTPEEQLITSPHPPNKNPLKPLQGILGLRQ